MSISIRRHPPETFKSDFGRPYDFCCPVDFNGWNESDIEDLNFGNGGVTFSGSRLYRNRGGSVYGYLLPKLTKIRIDTPVNTVGLHLAFSAIGSGDMNFKIKAKLRESETEFEFKEASEFFGLITPLNYTLERVEIESMSKKCYVGACQIFNTFEDQKRAFEPFIDPFVSGPTIVAPAQNPIVTAKTPEAIVEIPYRNVEVPDGIADMSIPCYIG
jgi:hypothetical protein